MIKLQKLDLKLDTLDVLVEDPNSNTPNSFYLDIIDIPQVVSVGKTKFLVGGSKYLKKGAPIKFELRDSQGKIIYTEAVDASYSEGEYKPISIVVYNDDNGGQANLTIMAELETYVDDNGVERPVPDNWKGLYNLRWSNKLLIDKTTHINKEPIHFYKQPTINASELISQYVSISGSIADATFTHSLGAVKVINFWNGETQPPQDYNYVRVKSKDYTDPTTSKVVSASFTSDLIGGIVSIPKHISTGSYNGLVDDFTGSITNVISSDTLEVQTDALQFSQTPQQVTYPFYIDAGSVGGGMRAAQIFYEDGTNTMGTFPESDVLGNPQPPYYPDLSTYLSNTADSLPPHVNGGATGYSISYISASYTETQRYISYAKLDIKNLKTYSGDVDRVRIFVKPSNGSEELNLGELKLQSENVFIKPIGSGNSFFDTSLGKFISQDFINTNYSASLVAPAGDVFATNLNNTLPTMSYVTEPLMNGLKLQGSIEGMLDHYKLEYSGSPINFDNGVEYKLKMKLYGSKNSETNLSQTNFSTEEIQKAKIHVYMSGSAFNNNHNIDDFTQEDTDVWWGNSMIRGYFDGKRVYSKLIDDEIDNILVEDVDINFIVDTTGSAKPVFYVESGEWTISDVKIEVSHEDGFSPESYTAYIPIDKSIDEDVLTFRTEFYNINNEPAQIEASSEPTDFAGGNEVLSGDSNLVSGQVFIGNTVGSGIEMAGISSGYIRSIGYQGFTKAKSGAGQPGFFFWSGSVLPDSGDNYSGIGMELHAGGDSGSFKFRSDTNELDIRADKFFVGRTSQQYVSGADANIEISSSNFWLKPDGGVIVGADAVIEGSLSAQEIFTPALIGGAQSNVTNASASITSQGFAKFVSASIGGFDVSTDRITSNNLILNSTGSIETADFVSGQKGWKISDGGLAEFENAIIRGTLGTTVFEKDTVSAIGGQLMIANSTTLTGSITSSETTMSLANAGGFVPGEILLAKATSSTGFFTEYIKIDTVITSSEPHQIYVQRGLEKGDLTISGALEDGQVIVSQGASGGGFIHMNAAPSGSSLSGEHSPYIDIIQRTGSNPDDTVIKARLGRLSGISSTKVGVSPGYGLYSENVFLEGTISASAGYVGNWNINSGMLRDSGDKFRLEPNGNYVISSSGFQVNPVGAITSSQGLIAGWKIASSDISKNNVFLDSNQNSLVVKDINNENMVKLGSGSLAKVTGSTSILSNGTFNHTQSGWFFSSASITTTPDEWPTAGFSGSKSCSLEVTNSNASDTDGQHIRVFVPESNVGAEADAGDSPA